MSILTYEELVDFVARGHVENVKPEHINGASIDLTLADGFYTEAVPDESRKIVRLGEKATPLMKYSVGHLILRPGDFALAATEQVFNLPNDVAGHYMLKSSLARSGLQHLFAGFADPTFNGSHLTLELQNVLRHHSLLLRPGDKIGQMVFWRGRPVPDEASYANRGQYNGLKGAQQSLGVR
jgi:dCTP deaminase